VSATLQPDAAADREIGPTLAQVIAFAPDREGMLLATDPRRDVSSAVTYDGSRSVTIKAAIPQVRFRNRDSGDRYAESARLGGDYYVAVQLSGSARVAVPVTISVAVHGEPDGRPRFARPVGRPRWAGAVTPERGDGTGPKLPRRRSAVDAIRGDRRCVPASSLASDLARRRCRAQEPASLSGAVRALSPVLAS